LESIITRLLCGQAYDSSQTKIMTTILDESLYSYHDRIKGKVVLITGAAAGIGRETALQFARHGAKVVIGDLNAKGSEELVEQITKGGGNAVSMRTDVTNWDDQVALFELAMKKFDSVDVVVVNAGVTEIGQFETVEVVNGLPVKPTVKTIEINLIAAMYTTHLAIHYLQKKQGQDSVKAIALLGSMASWQAIPRAEMYTASKHGILGFGRSLTPFLATKGIRISVIHPWFADTAIVPVRIKIALAGIPLAPLERIAGAIFYSATDPDPTTHGSTLLLLDDGPVLRLEKEKLTRGVYKMMDERAKWVEKNVNKFKIYIDLIRILREKLPGRKLIYMFVLLVAAVLYYQRYL